MLHLVYSLWSGETWAIPTKSRSDNPMFRFTLSYVRYALTALSTVAFGLSTN